MASPGHGIDNWKENTCAFDRVLSVSQSVSKPRSASWIAKQAAVSEPTARNHLEQLVELTVLLQHSQENQVKYAPDPLHTRLQAIRHAWDEHDRDDLNTQKEELQNQIKMWSHESGTKSPQALRQIAANSKTAADTERIRRTANKWDLVEYRLSIIEEAINKYDAYNLSECG